MESYWNRLRREREAKKEKNLCIVYSCKGKAIDRNKEYCLTHSSKWLKLPR